MADLDDGWTVPGYRHLRELGAGASGRVLLAERVATGEPVAIKYLNRRLLSDPRFLADFSAEAATLARLRSPHIARVEEYVRGPGGAAIVLELVQGVPLSGVLAAEGATGPEAALAVLKGSLLGLATAHAAGVVHRDYKPGNVLVTAEGRSVLVDFGIAARTGEAVRAAGTPAYMAPEQWRSGTASPAADVYAATAVFFECVVGRRPYTAPTTAALAAQHMTAPIPVENAPEPLQDLIRAGLAKTPGDRPADAAAFVAELEAVAVAGYGLDWEERGIRALAMLAAALAGLFPLGAAMGAGVGVGVGTTAGQAPAVSAAPDGMGIATGKSSLRSGRRATTVKAVAAVSAVLVTGALAGGYVATRKASGRAAVRPPAASAKPAIVSPTPTITPAAMTGTYRLKLRSKSLKPGLTSLERTAVNRVIAQVDGQQARLTTRVGKLRMRVGSAESVTLTSRGPGRFGIPGGGRIAVGPQDLRNGRITGFTLTTPVLVRTLGGTTKPAGQATFVATRR